MKLTKKQVKTAHTKVLNSRYCRLLEKGEKLPAQNISVGEAREFLWIEDELHQRLIKQLGRDPYPPDRIEKKAPSNYMISLLKSRKSPPQATEIIHPCSAVVTKKAEVAKKAEGNLRFKITITSSIGSVVAQQNVKVDSKSDANLMARLMIEQLGLKKATYKIS